MRNKGGSEPATAEREKAVELSFFEQYDLIAQSGWFDADFYLNGAPAIGDSRSDPILHYLESGASEGLAPHPDFDPQDYVEQCVERGIEPGNPLLHYLVEGQRLGMQPKAVPADRAAPDPHQWTIDKLLPSGLFDLAFYNAAYKFSFASDAEGLRHLLAEGIDKGYRPNLYLDPAWYLKNNPALRDAGTSLLIHYLFEGDFEGRQPSLLFDPAWYRRIYQLPPGQNALAHYLAHSRSYRHSPIPEFDVLHYADVNKDVRDAGVDPFEHFLLTGFREGRQPSTSFNLRYYARRYLGGSTATNPLLHYLEHKDTLTLDLSPEDDHACVSRAVRRYTSPAAEFEDFKPLPPSAPRRAKVLAYYLPQFHAFAENDQWWGKGFTEWTNVARGVSRFEGHYQPRIPRDLGFYSLESPETLKRQVVMARQAGVHGFVFYHYWFNGKRLMQTPVENFLSDAGIDMPFALMWANENWTRRWDGADSQVLISQDYDRDDDPRLVADFARHFGDSRYIRIDGRPLLMIYRPGLIPRARQTIALWRELFERQFQENPILMMVLGFGDDDPRLFGLDGAIEFPPHKLAVDLPAVNNEINISDPDFVGEVFRYDDLVTRSLAAAHPDFPLIKTAVPSWDNDARRQGAGMTFTGSTPAKYEAWLRELIQLAEQRPFFGERLVCVNAWNEWCEAAYLEPDLHFGSAYLNATGRAVAGVAADASAAKLLLVGHDACANGAQELLLNIARTLRSAFGVQVEVLLLGGGPLEKAYRDIAPTHVANDAIAIARVLRNLRQQGYANAIVNTIAGARILRVLEEAGFATTCLVHELPRIIHDMNLQAAAEAALTRSRHVIFAADVVRTQVAAAVGVRVDDRMLVLPQGAYKQFSASSMDASQIRVELGIGAGERLVVAVGYGDLRKGFDLFLQCWRQANAVAPVHFCWVGNIEKSLQTWLATEIGLAKDQGTFHLPGFRRDVDAFLLAADAFVLSSREDPFPSVVHEALFAGLPVLVFESSGGMPDFLRTHDMGTVVAHGDVLAMVSALLGVLAQDRLPAEIKRRRDFVVSELDFRHYVQRLASLALPGIRQVSVAVPNYNYARHLPARLASVFQQSYPVNEVLVLDDHSQDGSVAVIEDVAAQWQRDIRLMPNTVNSGSVFLQWRKAAEAASGEFIWIAEADDLSDPRFLASMIEAMGADDSIDMGFCDSRAIDEHGDVLSDSYKAYYAEQEPGVLGKSEVFTGREFARRFLAVRNLILNVSSVVWRRAALLRALDACQADLQSLRMAGDWRLYLEMLLQPGVRLAYVADPFNVHRRHASSVTHALDGRRHVDEIARCQSFAAEALRLTAAERQPQATYLGKVRLQLGVDAGTLAGGTRKRKRPRLAIASERGLGE